MINRFRAILITKEGQDNADQQHVELGKLGLDDLMDGDVSIDVQYSTLNYKDALAITGTSPVVRRFPMVPGIDLAGTVNESTDPRFKAGDEVILNGWGVGEVHYGGYAQKARVKADWLTLSPTKMTAIQAMAVGTAGYTAMLCVLELERHGLRPEAGPVLVTGATGGVGSVAIALLTKLGFRVTASTGRIAQFSEYLTELGAVEVLDRNELAAKGRPLDKQRWAGAIDSVGGATLANVLASTFYGGVVAACGLAGGTDLPATVMPFILRNVTLAGVDSVMAQPRRRDEAWKRLVEDLDFNKLEKMSHMIGLADVVDAARDLLGGKVRGRTIVDVNS